MTDYNPYSSDYDDQASRYKWHGPDVVLGLMYEFIESGQALLDIGIGTGLSSMPFQKAGLSVFGIDGSAEMLAACRLKEFTEELIQHDINKLPLPYPNASFHHVISLGVFQMLPDLTDLFGDVSRILKDLGAFGFTYGEHKPGANDGFKSIRD
ncbi:MAG: class I SAM-dependent methyltransferase, partial [Candidatus Latescibacterota bacterium]